MKKQTLLLLTIFICIPLMMGLVSCGGETEETKVSSEADANTEAVTEPKEQLSPEQLNEKMIGVWLPAEGVEDDKVTFLYSSESGYSNDSGGQLCIHVGYGKTEGGGISSVEYEYSDGKLIYSTFDSDHNAGGKINDEWIVEVDSLSDNKATINGIAYEKITDDPSDPEQRAKKIINSRFIPMLVGEWEGFEGMVNIKLNEDGTMHYGDTSMEVDGTWEPVGGMSIMLSYVDPYSNETESDNYHYTSDGDYLEGMGRNQGKFTRK